MADIRVVWDHAAVKMVASDPRVLATMDRLAARAVLTMKRLTPVSPVYPVYARPVPLGRSRGKVYRTPGLIGKGLAWPGGPDVSRRRLPGDLPLNVSGRLRQSVGAQRVSAGEILIGPNLNPVSAHVRYAAYVNDGTRPHVIRSTGPWPLRNRATGQVFGRVVHHPGTRGVHFIERTARELGGTVIHV
jgi:hypothetical protein